MEILHGFPKMVMPVMRHTSHLLSHLSGASG